MLAVDRRDRRGTAPHPAGPPDGGRARLEPSCEDPGAGGGGDGAGGTAYTWGAYVGRIRGAHTWGAYVGRIRGAHTWGAYVGRIRRAR
jgi:hypothetical protein